MNHLTRYFVALLLPLVFSVAALAQTLRLGVMLPLHDDNGDGRRMVEYYRGVLMACDSLKKTGLSIDVHAWNLAEFGDVSVPLSDPAAARCDLIIGPLYSRYVRALSDFVTQHDTRLLIPFSITAPALYTNPRIFQVYQNPNDFTARSIDSFEERFRGFHPIFIDCNDTTSKKGIFTFGLRKRLDAVQTAYNVTNLKSSEEAFAKAFSSELPNVVILNTGRSEELGVALAKLDGLKTAYPGLRISLYGYTEWLGYTRLYLDQFYRYDTYIPSPFYTNMLSSQTLRMKQKYRWNFHTDMMQSLPQFALTGFDHTMFFLQGLSRYGKQFTGEEGQSVYKPVQTPLVFERIATGGLRNKTCLLVHYRPDQRVETIQ